MRTKERQKKITVKKEHKSGRNEDGKTRLVKGNRDKEKKRRREEMGENMNYREVKREEKEGK